jgi:hypothetical protein
MTQVFRLKAEVFGISISDLQPKRLQSIYLSRYRTARQSVGLRCCRTRTLCI